MSGRVKVSRWGASRRGKGQGERTWFLQMAQLSTTMSCACRHARQYQKGPIKVRGERRAEADGGD